VSLFYHTGVNLLAHVFFANAEPAAIVGQLCGDFVRGSRLDQFPAPIQAAIRAHRAIDSFTDSHPLNRQARALFAAPHRRFAGIIIDVAYDHFLAKDWHSYCDIALPDYAKLVSEALELHHSVLPQNLQRFAPYLRSEKILQNNIHKKHIELTLTRISNRRESMAPLATAGGPLWSNEISLRQIFDEFFPLLIKYVDETGAVEQGSRAAKQQADNKQVFP